jgi:hypothetical protein
MAIIYNILYMYYVYTWVYVIRYIYSIIYIYVYTCIYTYRYFTYIIQCICGIMDIVRMYTSYNSCIPKESSSSTRNAWIAWRTSCSEARYVRHGGRI